MKTLQQMLRELARPDVAEFAVASDRLPCIKVGGKYEPVDDTRGRPRHILEMLVAAGGSRYVDDLEAQAGGVDDARSRASARSACRR